MLKINLQSVWYGDSASTVFITTINKPTGDKTEVKLETGSVDIETDLVEIQIHTITIIQSNVANISWKESFTL